MDCSVAIKPGKIRKAVGGRLQHLVQSSQDSLYAQQLITNIINVQSYLIDKMILLLSSQHNTTNAADLTPPLEPLLLPPFQNQAPDKTTQLNHHLAKVNAVLRQIEHLAQPEEDSTSAASFRIPSAAKVHQIEPRENYQYKLHQEAQQTKAAMEAIKALRKRNPKPVRKPAPSKAPEDQQEKLQQHTTGDSQTE